MYGTKQGLPFAVVVVVAAVVDEGPWPEIKFWMIIRKMASKKGSLPAKQMCGYSGGCT